DVPRLVGADRPAPVQAGRGLDEVPLRLERRALVVQPAVEHGRGVALPPRLRLARPHPGDVNPAVLADGQVSPSNAAGGDDAAGLTVDAQGRGEPRAVLGAGVEHVAVT